MLERAQLRDIFARYYDELPAEEQAKVREQSGERYERLTDAELDDLRRDADVIAQSLVETFREKTVQGRPSRFVPYRGLRPRHPRPRRARGAA